MLTHVLQTQSIVLKRAEFSSECPKKLLDGFNEQFRIINDLDSNHEEGVRVTVDPLTNGPSVKLDYSGDETKVVFFPLNFRIPVLNRGGLATGTEHGPRLAASAFTRIRDFCNEVNGEIARQIKEANLDAKNGNSVDFAMKAREIFGGIDFDIITNLGEHHKFVVRKEQVRNAIIVGCDYSFLQSNMNTAFRGDEASYIELTIHLFGDIQ